MISLFVFVLSFVSRPLDGGCCVALQNGGTLCFCFIACLFFVFCMHSLLLIYTSHLCIPVLRVFVYFVSSTSPRSSHRIHLVFPSCFIEHTLHSSFIIQLNQTVFIACFPFSRSFPNSVSFPPLFPLSHSISSPLQQQSHTLFNHTYPLRLYIHLSPTLLCNPRLLPESFS